MVSPGVWNFLEAAAYVFFLLVVAWIVKTNYPDQNKGKIVLLILVFLFFFVTQAVNEITLGTYVVLTVVKLFVSILAFFVTIYWLGSVISKQRKLAVENASALKNWLQEES